MYRGALESKKRQLSANEHPLQLPSFFLLLLLLSLPSDHLHHELQLCSLMNIPRKKNKTSEKEKEKKGHLLTKTNSFCTSSLYNTKYHRYTPLAVLFLRFLPIRYPITIPSKFLLRVHTRSPRNHGCGSIISPLTLAS